MKEFLKEVWDDVNNKRGIIAAGMTFVTGFFVSVMFGVNMIVPSAATGGCWAGTIVVSWFMFMGFSGRFDD